MAGWARRGAAEWRDVVKREQVVSQLSALPPSALVTFAARAAARVVPALARDLHRNDDVLAVLTLGVFRANALARCAAKYPHRAAELAAAAATASAVAYCGVEDAEVLLHSLNAAAVAEAASGAAATVSRTSSAAAGLAYTAFSRAADAAGVDRDDVACAAAAALAALPPIDAALLLDDAPPWPVAPGGATSPPRAGCWGVLKAALLARTHENWSVWTQWYDAWSVGRRPCPRLTSKARENLEVGVCLIDEAVCGQPAGFNDVMRGMISAAGAAS